MMKLRWGIISCGRIASDFVEALHLLSTTEHEVVAVATGNSLERAEKFLVDHDLKNAKAYGCYDLLYSDHDVDVVYVANFHNAHKETVIKAIENGKNVLCEKPMGINPTEVKEMIVCARKHNKFLMEGFWTRFWPAFKQLREELYVKKTLQDPTYVAVNFGKGGPIDKLGSFGSAATCGSSLLALGCYNVMFASLVFKHSMPEKITAQAFKNAEGMDMTGCATFKYSGDRFAQISFSFSQALGTSAVITGSNQKTITLENFWCPTKLITPEKVYEYELPKSKRNYQFNYGRSAGFHYEASAVRDCIMKGLTENPEMTLDQSVVISEIMLEIRNEMGVVFPQEQ